MTMQSKKRIPPHNGTRSLQAQRPPLIRDGPMDDGRRCGKGQSKAMLPRHDGRRENLLMSRGLRRTRKMRISRLYSPLTEHIKRGPSLHGSTA